jgi:hypothetical protein
VLHALVELFVGEMYEGAGFAKLLLDGLVPDAFSFDVDRQAFGYKAHFTMQSFGQHAAVAFDLVDPVIDFIESTVQVLNKFLIHTTSALCERLR